VAEAGGANPKIFERQVCKALHHSAPPIAIVKACMLDNQWIVDGDTGTPLSVESTSEFLA
jgi:hypothetical protein